MPILKRYQDEAEEDKDKDYFMPCNLILVSVINSMDEHRRKEQLLGKQKGLRKTLQKDEAPNAPTVDA